MVQQRLFEFEKEPPFSFQEKQLCEEFFFGRTIVINDSWLGPHANLKRWGKDEGVLIYIGKGEGRGRLCSDWHNPIAFKEGVRDCAMYEFVRYLSRTPELLQRITNGELEKKVLSCECPPKSCHGDILAYLANSLAGAYVWRPTQTLFQLLAELEECLLEKAEKTSVRSCL